MENKIETEKNLIKAKEQQQLMKYFNLSFEKVEGLDLEEGQADNIHMLSTATISRRQRYELTELSWCTNKQLEALIELAINNKYLPIKEFLGLSLTQVNLIKKYNFPFSEVVKMGEKVANEIYDECFKKKTSDPQTYCILIGASHRLEMSLSDMNKCILDHYYLVMSQKDKKDTYYFIVPIAAFEKAKVQKRYVLYIDNLLYIPCSAFAEFSSLNCKQPATRYTAPSPLPGDPQQIPENLATFFILLFGVTKTATTNVQPNGWVPGFERKRQEMQGNTCTLSENRNLDLIKP